ncbi:MAG: DUF6134 family protein [Magnetospirillum sp.]
MRLTKHVLPFAAAALTLCGAMSAQAAPGGLDFTVLRDGDPVGSHSLRFRQDGDSLRVTIDTNVVVKVAMIPVYRFEHHGVEVWTGGHLSTLFSKTNDDGTHHDVTVKAAAADLEVTGDGVQRREALDEVPASLWNEKTIKQNTLLNTLDGHSMQVKVMDQGADSIKAAGRDISARHYVMSGDLARELWYDDGGTLVQVKFKAKDGSDILYQLK